MLLQELRAALKAQGVDAFDLVFIDHEKTVYLSDLQLLVKEGLIRQVEGCCFTLKCCLCVPSCHLVHSNMHSWRMHFRIITGVAQSLLNLCAL